MFTIVLPKRKARFVGGHLADTIKMKLEFTNTISDDIKLNSVLMSGCMSADYSNQIFLTLSEDGTIMRLYKIKYERHCSPFKEALLFDNLLAVGHEEHFYLFDMTTNQNIVRLALSGYFGHLYYDNQLFYIADAHGLHCIDKNGEIHWTNLELAIDGVIVHGFTDNIILGSGEFDPPGGWVDFSIEKATGNKTA
ncbi:MAG: hypothetical protein JNL32_04345 [Candidatus Kapabacteria bacterium]|nr:hypothetical protein [Candidatus Kapabacteria bacterium]